VGENKTEWKINKQNITCKIKNDVCKQNENHKGALRKQTNLILIGFGLHVVELSFCRFDTGTADSTFESLGVKGGWFFNKETCCTCCGSELLTCCLLRVLGPIPVDLPLLDATGLNLSTNLKLSNGRMLKITGYTFVAETPCFQSAFHSPTRNLS
jgi:hypothetical protein